MIVIKNLDSSSRPNHSIVEHDTVIKFNLEPNNSILFEQVVVISRTNNYIITG